MSTPTTKAIKRVDFAFAALLALWVIELFLVQELSLFAPHSQTVSSPHVNRVVRLLLDTTICGLALTVIPRKSLPWLFGLNLLFYVTVLCYRDYFEQSLSVLVVQHHAGEGASVISAALSLLRPWHLLLVASFLAKLYLARQLREPASGTRTRRVAVALSCLYVLGLLFLNATLKPMWKIAKWESVGGTGTIYGYLPTWFAELVYIDSSAVLARALERATQVSDRLRDREVPLTVKPRLVFVQVESLDLALMDFQIRGEEVVPNLNRIAERSMYLAVQAEKKTGSSDADFLALTGKLSSADVATYKILDYPYDNSFVERIEDRGYETSAIHNVSGEFYNRRYAYKRIGFDRLVFKEELVEGGYVADGWAVPDPDLLDYAARDLASLDGRQFQIVITATTHIPFHTFDVNRAHFFPGSHEPEDNYLDSFHQVDAALGRYIDSLPPDTTVVLYGDHTSKVEQPEVAYRQIETDGVGCVPFLIYDTSEDLSAKQATPRPAGTCALTLQDAILYVHHYALEPAAPTGPARASRAHASERKAMNAQEGPRPASGIAPPGMEEAGQTAVVQ